MFIDTHVHLNSEKYDNIAEIIKRAKEKGVTKMIVSGYDYSSSKKAVEIANTYEGVYASVGLHPSDCKDEKDLELKWLVDLIKEKKVIAIGEIGLDYYWNKSYADLQKQMFIKQLNIAKINDLPIVVHSREASLDTWNILKNSGVKGVLHCYSGSLEMAREYVKVGFYLGIGGVLTFSNSRILKKVVEEIDLDFLVSETDAPYLTPSPFRGKINYPEYVVYVVEEISKIKKIHVNEVALSIQKNVRKLFKI